MMAAMVARLSRVMCGVALALLMVGPLASIAVSQPQDPKNAPTPSDNTAQKKSDTGPHGTTKVGNTKCPMMNNKPVHATKGFAYNGWWIAICCSMCEKRFKNDVAKYAPAIKEETGHDVTTMAPREAGPNGTVRLGNTMCPVGNEAVVADKGFAYNGWWINCCCDSCGDDFSKDAAKFAAKLLEQTGLDVTKPAPKQTPDKK